VGRLTAGEQFTRLRDALMQDAILVQPAAKVELDQQTPSIDEDPVSRALRSFDDRIVEIELIELCRDDFAREAYADASRKATQFLSQKVLEKCEDELVRREDARAAKAGRKPGVLKDGTALMQQVFALEDPVLLIPKRLRSQADQSEQLGYGNLMQGVIGAFRNPRSHDVYYEDDPLQAVLIIELVQHLYEIARNAQLKITTTT
jgi:uncharacterized protein (TIGR02391 family)